jgi:predicted AlkP superfamily phosphohydrolase/phosphomutase
MLMGAWKKLTPAMRHRLRPLGRRRWGILPSAPADWIVPRLDESSTCWVVPNGEVYGAIRVNLAGREPRGRIQPGSEMEDFCQRLRRDFCALVNADTGAPAVRDVLRTADFESGPHLAELPDLLVEWNTDTPLNAVHSEKTGTIRRVFGGDRSGHHRREGLFAVRGPSVRPRRLAEPISIMDVAPTITSLLGVTLPDIDGKVIPATMRE